MTQTRFANLLPTNVCDLIIHYAKQENVVVPDTWSFETNHDGSLKITDADNTLITCDIPFFLEELTDKMRDYMAQSHRDIAIIQDWVFRAYKRQINHYQQPTIELSDKESQLLEQLLSCPGFKSRERLLAKIWGYHPESDTNTVETHIYRLRQKLAPLGLSDDQGIITVDGGYEWR